MGLSGTGSIQLGSEPNTLELRELSADPRWNSSGRGCFPCGKTALHFLASEHLSCSSKEESVQAPLSNSQANTCKATEKSKRLLESLTTSTIRPRTKMFVTKCSCSTPFYTTEKGLYERFYIMLYNSSNVLLRSTAVDVSGDISHANQLSFKMQAELHAAFNDIAPDLFLTVYGQSERKMELKLNDPLNYKIKIPTDEELETYVNDKWDRRQFEYDNLRPKAINYLLSNYIAYEPATSW